MKTSELTGAALDWAVAKCEGEDYCDHDGMNGIGIAFEATRYSTDWSQGGPIIEREMIKLEYRDAAWSALMVYENDDTEDVFASEEFGPTPLIAAMRCYVASKLGDNVEIPEELNNLSRC
jgi:hypothetical protein